ncbi:phosphoribosylanthranilate isomerase [Listeria booriae]|uniref:N-(5'-phosphoribosyl)anthranilate isomerase n=1 Tax=Listeria booriae TaxID=1552123 RepID=A0A7X0XZJ0_9LIST|nr:phosphoribosylanthranilate isomerase [Listeria booriae]MBC1307337.1 phosphoribosylanthranilate isomerase [Listeria booriae]MBC1552589.1 phosphoribosylanthranilate isomerase [Listeria booriae]MBC1566622.1 phosphoribosylanthranilate isomerase [Listeria booriae]MBC1573338.1 phosphoribosylanthranilate isomerase [Listeria booriae]MBC1794633.1 phosphoribosylanthranilate isomerase [Listeria booriae]
MTQVKICGLKYRTDVDVAVANGADMIGFVFARSKRQVTADQAHMLAKNLPSTVKKVGVFVNESPSEINRIAATVPLDIVQCHGQETPEEVAKINYPTIKAFQVKDGKISGNIEAYPNSLLLLDAPASEYEGGSGETFDWESLNDTILPQEKIIIAGGLNAENVQTAIAKFHPFAVDISSGVETNGTKDPEKIITFIQKAKESK